ncbi:MAG: terminase small subunit [Acidobacteria bacterium]|nr:terminase small subunit [Acidobacteriota bacterium]
MRHGKRNSTPKQRHFIAAYVENGGNANQAATTAYPNATYATARMIGSENLTKPNIKAEIERVMGDVELTAKDAVRTIKRSLDATTESGHPNWGSQLKAADMTLKLTDAYPIPAHNVRSRRRITDPAVFVDSTWIKAQPVPEHNPEGIKFRPSCILLSVPASHWMPGSPALQGDGKWSTQYASGR